jgi:hypothetical protein
MSPHLSRSRCRPEKVAGWRTNWRRLRRGRSGCRNRSRPHKPTRTLGGAAQSPQRPANASSPPNPAIPSAPSTADGRIYRRERTRRAGPVRRDSCHEADAGQDDRLAVWDEGELATGRHGYPPSGYQRRGLPSTSTMRPAAVIRAILFTCTCTASRPRTSPSCSNAATGRSKPGALPARPLSPGPAGYRGCATRAGITPAEWSRAVPTRDKPAPCAGPSPIDHGRRRASRPLAGAPPVATEISLEAEAYPSGPAADSDLPLLLVWLRRALLLAAVAVMAIAVAEVVYRLGSAGLPPAAG